MYDLLETFNYGDYFWDAILAQKIETSNMYYNDMSCKAYLVFPNFGF